MQVLGTSTSNQRNSILKDVQILGTSETQFQKCEKKNNRSNICVVRRMDFFEGFPRCLSTFWCGSIWIEVQRDRWCTWCPCNGGSDTCKDDYGCKFRLGGTKLQKTGIRGLVLADLIAIARLPSSDKIFSPCFHLHLFLGKIEKFNKRPPVLSGQGEDTKNLGVFHLISFNLQPTGKEENFLSLGWKSTMSVLIW